MQSGLRRVCAGVCVSQVWWTAARLGLAATAVTSVWVWTANAVRFSWRAPSQQRWCTQTQEPITRSCQSSLNQINQITFIVTSPQHKCLGEWNSYERAPDSAEKQQTIYLWTDSAKKTTDNLHMDRQCKKQQQTIYIWTDSAKKKQQTIYIWTDSAKKTALEHLQCSRQCKKTQQQLFTYGQTVQKNNSNLHMDRQCKKTTAIYIWTDSAKKQQQFTYGQTVQKSNSNLHMDSTYLQTVQKTMCKIHIHILSTHSVL